MQYGYIEEWVDDDRGPVPVGVVVNVDTFNPYVLMLNPADNERWRRLFRDAVRARNEIHPDIPEHAMPYYYDSYIGDYVGRLRWQLYADDPGGPEKLAEKLIEELRAKLASKQRPEPKQLVISFPKSILSKKPKAKKSK